MVSNNSNSTRRFSLRVRNDSSLHLREERRLRPDHRRKYFIEMDGRYQVTIRSGSLEAVTETDGDSGYPTFVDIYEDRIETSGETVL